MQRRKIIKRQIDQFRSLVSKGDRAIAGIVMNKITQTK